MSAPSTLLLPLSLCFLTLPPLSAAESCADLSKLPLNHAHVLATHLIPAGTFLPPNIQPNSPESAPYQKLPPFCRAVVESTPSADSQIAIEVWLPTAASWNHKFRGQGNGGFAGALDFHGMAGSLSLGYLTASTDAGHKGEATDAGWALHHPEKVKDFGYRAIHEMTQIAQTLGTHFYGAPPQWSYFDSCSDGGREALMEAQRYPGDYNGILAGAPANGWTHLLTAGLQALQVGEASPANFIPPAKLTLITHAVLRSCDPSHGLRDGFLKDPSQCRFNPSTLLCKGTETATCLSAAQVATVKQIYKGGTTSTGAQIFPGLMPSSEAGDTNAWQDWVTGPAFGKASGQAYTSGFFQNMVYEDPSWNFRTADVDRSLHDADRKLAPILNSTDPHLDKFQARGGKLILYHGWLDSAISPLNTIAYYQSVVAAMGQSSVDSFMRLYMVPGMRHCVGGPGPFIFGQLGVATSRDPEHNIFTALEQWTEHGAAPHAITATKLKDDKDPAKGVSMTRPLCPFHFTCQSQ